jgi:hypothetical protein
MRTIEPRTILLDFDGTTIFHSWPHMSDPVPGAVEMIKRLISSGHKIILHTNRAGIQLDDAIEFFRNNDIPLFAINENPDFESGSRKIYGHLVIDDHNLGMPMTYDPSIHPKPFVNWHRVREYLLINKYI